MTTATVDAPAAGLRRQIANVVGYVVVLTVNALANALPINGITSGAVSDRFPTFVTPAGYVFGIWGVIYALLAVFVGWQALPAQRDDPRLARLGWAFVLSCACNASWLLAWHHLQIGLAWLLIVALLLSLIACYERLRGPTAGRLEWFAMRLPFSVYLGWVTVATVANTAIVGVDLGFDGGAAAPLWGALALVAATAIGLVVLARRGDIAFALVLVWALVGIAVAQGSRSGVIAATTAVTCGALVAAIAVVALRRRRRPVA
jgi:benzodiazapine receptor